MGFPFDGHRHSAIVAIYRRELEAETFARLIVEDDQPCISVATVVEVSIILRSAKVAHFSIAETWLNNFLATTRLQTYPVTAEDAALAREAHIRFGKGTGHPAQLNFGDCFAYALAKRLNVPLLFKGSDFSKTDIATALPYNT